MTWGRKKTEPPSAFKTINELAMPVLMRIRKMCPVSFQGVLKHGDSYIEPQSLDGGGWESMIQVEQSCALFRC